MGGVEWMVLIIVLIVVMAIEKDHIAVLDSKNV